MALKTETMVVSGAFLVILILGSDRVKRLVSALIINGVCRSRNALGRHLAGEQVFRGLSAYVPTNFWHLKAILHRPLDCQLEGLFEQVRRVARCEFPRPSISGV